jgi:hypothetical protein
MTQLIITTGTEDQFFKNGRELAKVADCEKQLPYLYTVSFEDSTELIDLISSTPIAVLQSIEEVTASIHLRTIAYPNPTALSSS